MTDTTKGTPFSKIYTFALTNFEDEIDLPRENPALLYRRLFLYLQNGIPRFNMPRGIEDRLQYHEPKFDDFLIQSDGVSLTYATDITDMEIVTASIDGEIINSAYDPVTGEVTLGEVYPLNTLIDVDFYTDGYFLENLNATEQSILGFCVALMWYNRFKNDGLNMTPKLQDRAFKVGSEHANINANTSRYNEMLTELANMLNDYAFSQAYKKIVPPSKQKFGGG